MIKLFCGQTKYDEDCFKYNPSLTIKSHQMCVKGAFQVGGQNARNHE
jgi:hypothetical protein